MTLGYLISDNNKSPSAVSPKLHTIHPPHNQSSSFTLAIMRQATSSSDWYAQMPVPRPKIRPRTGFYYATYTALIACQLAANNVFLTFSSRKKDGQAMLVMEIEHRRRQKSLIRGLDGKEHLQGDDHANAAARAPILPIVPFHPFQQPCYRTIIFPLCRATTIEMPNYRRQHVHRNRYAQEQFGTIYRYCVIAISTHTSISKQLSCAHEYITDPKLQTILIQNTVQPPKHPSVQQQSAQLRITGITFNHSFTELSQVLAYTFVQRRVVEESKIILMVNRRTCD